MSCKNMAFGKKKPKTKEKVIEKVTVAPKVAPKPKITNVYTQKLATSLINEIYLSNKALEA